MPFNQVSEKPAALELGSARRIRAHPTLATVPSPPLLFAGADSIQSTRLTLSWYGSPMMVVTGLLANATRNTSCVTEAPSCTVYQFPVDAMEGTFVPVASLVAHTAQSVTTLEVHSIAANTSYQFRVVAVNSLGAGQPGPASEELATLSAIVPDPPTNLIVDSATFSSVKVSWRTPSDTKGYPLLSYKLQRTKGQVLYDAAAEANDGAVTKERDAAAIV